MAVVVGVAIAVSAIASIYQLIQLLAAQRFFHWRRLPAGAPENLPPVTILKPLKGEGIDLYANLASFCRQDYPRYQIVFGVEDATDPAVTIVRKVMADFPEHDLALSVGWAEGSNRKVANLIHMMPHAKHDVLVLSDGDIRVRPDYLTTMVTPLMGTTAKKSVGLTTCLYRGRGYFGLPSVLESLLINTDFIPMVMVGDWTGIRAGYGASIAVKREALDAIGGFPAIADHLADDYLLGNRVHGAGYEIVVLPYVVETVLDSRTLGDVGRHQLRWQRTYRVQQPVGWFASIVTHATLWGVVSVLITGGSPLGWAMFFFALACRLGSLAGIMRLLNERVTPRWLPMVPLKDLGFSAIWAVCWFGRDVNWSGQVLHVDADGRMRPVGVEPALEVESRLPIS